jgi:uncharacterized protein YjbI with pentapeptide repeats
MQSTSIDGLTKAIAEGSLNYDFFVGKYLDSLVFPVIGDMSSFVFHKAKFNGVIFIDSDFGSSDLSGAVFENCCFRGCSMAKTQQYETVYTRCILYDINFKNARLNSVCFSSCIIGGSSFQGAIIADSLFADSVLLDKFDGVSLIGSHSISTVAAWF